jgi:hypothetical protein
MKGAIRDLLESTEALDMLAVQDVFGDNFQTRASWVDFLTSNLVGGLPTSHFQAAPSAWKVGSFQALYVACWIHHPVEKGTYMISLAGMARPGNVKDAMKNLLTTRKSSHLSGKGFSAKKRWHFLKGYEELLVQYELDNNAVPFLLLKAEGHGTGITGVVPHIKSWRHKVKHGEGLQASPALNNLARHNPLVAMRSAENYDKEYETLLKTLGFKDMKNTSVRQMFKSLCRETAFSDGIPSTASNKTVGEAIARYCSTPATTGMANRFNLNGKLTPGMLRSLQGLSDTLIKDNHHTGERVFQEVRVTPMELNASIRNFIA